MDRAHGSGTRNRTRGSASIAESPTSIFRRRYERSWRALRQEETALRHSTAFAAVCGLPSVGLRLGWYRTRTTRRTGERRIPPLTTSSLHHFLTTVTVIAMDWLTVFTVYSVICGIRGTLSKLPEGPPLSCLRWLRTVALCYRHQDMGCRCCRIVEGFMQRFSKARC